MAKPTSQATHEIATAAQDAVKVIAAAAAEALKVSNKAIGDDHELFIRMDEKLARVILDVADIKTNTVSRIDTLEINCINKNDHTKVVDDIVVLKNWKNWLLGGLAILSIFFVPMVFLVLSNLSQDSGNQAVILQIQKDNDKTNSELQLLLNR
jgi:hypothetical protein